MPSTNSKKSDVIPVRATKVMRRQIDELVEAGYGTQSDVIRIAVDRLHQQAAQPIEYPKAKLTPEDYATRLAMVERSRARMDAGDYVTEEEFEAGLKERGLA